MTTRQQIQAKAHRLIVFRAVKTFKDGFGRWPTNDELAELVTELAPNTIRTIAWEIRRASGLGSPRSNHRAPITRRPLVIMDDSPLFSGEVR